MKKFDLYALTYIITVISGMITYSATSYIIDHESNSQTLASYVVVSVFPATIGFSSFCLMSKYCMTQPPVADVDANNIQDQLSLHMSPSSIGSLNSSRSSVCN